MTAAVVISGPLGYATPLIEIETSTNPTASKSDEHALTKQAEKLHSEGDYIGAAAIWRQLLAFDEKQFGPDHPSTALSLNNLAYLLQMQGRYAEAGPLFRSALAIRESSLGPNHPDVAISLNNLAGLLRDQGQHATAEPLQRRSLSILEKNLGPNHLDVALSLNNLALLLNNKGEYAESESLFRRALSIREKSLGSNHPDVAISLNNLASLLHDRGYYAAAETLYRRSLAIRERSLGRDHPGITRSLNNLASLLQDQGQHDKAEVLFRRALAIREKALGANHPDVALSLNNLALLLKDLGRYATAEPLQRRSLAITVKAFGPDHPNVATSLNNLALLLQAQGHYIEAEPLYRRSLEINERTLGASHLTVAYSLNNLASLLQDQGHDASAGPLIRRALAIREKALGLNHPDVAAGFNSLALFLGAQGQHRISISMLKRSLAIESAWLAGELPLLPDQARSRQLLRLGYAWEWAFGWIDRYPPAAELALDTRLNRQGLLPEIEQRQALLLNAPGIDRSKVEQLRALTQQLASVSLSAEQRPTVRGQRDRLQAEVYRQVPELQLQTVTSAAVGQTLPSDGVLVEFQRFQPFDRRKPRNQRWGEPQYIALVLKPNGSISAVSLGAAAAIDATVQKSLRSTAEGLSDADALWAQLSNQVLLPLVPHLSGSRQWFFSPDGELNRVPFAALPAPQQPSTPLAAAVQLRLLTTGRELVRLQQAAPAGSAAVVMANPSYDRHGGMDVAATQQDDAAALAQRRSADLGSNRWLPLPGTEREGQQVASLLGTRLISGSGATTTALQQQQGPRVLHVATHGFFVADQAPSPADPLRAVQEQASQLNAFRGEDPLLRSGLVLAGANQPDLDPKDDGYLTAAEALTLKLKGTELVVLSACSTAQGDIRTGEGVYGLQRALTVAGARSTLLSLWKVDDAATAEFMTRFYRRLKAGEGRADALATVQQEFRDGKTGNNTWREPAYWAAWQLVGDWRPIQGL